MAFLFGHIKKMLYICTVNLRWGMSVHRWRRGADIFKRRLLALCSDALKSRKFQSSSELSNDRCPTGYRLSLMCLFWYHTCVYAYARTRILTMWHGEYLYSAWASRCRFKMMGNARALEHGTAIVGLHAFFICLND